MEIRGFLCYASNVPLAEKTRRLLWSRSGGRCAFCRTQLVMEAAPKSDAASAGEECHIVSSRVEGARHDRFFPGDSIDDVSNLILLCKTHHRLVDGNPVEYSTSALRLLKARHERRAEAAVEELVGRKGQPKLARLGTGSEVLAAILGVDGLDFGKDEPASGQETELITSFQKLVSKWGELGSQVPVSKQVQVSYQLTAEIEALLRSGFVVYGARITRPCGTESGKSRQIAAIRVFRKSNPIVSR